MRTAAPTSLVLAATLLVACGPGKSPATGGSAERMINARDLVTLDDCKAYYGVPFKVEEEMFMGHNPPTQERDHVTILRYGTDTADSVQIITSQSVSTAEAHRRDAEERAYMAKEPNYEEAPGFGDSKSYWVDAGTTVKFVRGSLSVSIKASGLKDPYDKPKVREACLAFAKKIDDRLK